MKTEANKHSSASFKPLLYSLLGSTQSLTMWIFVVATVVPAIHQSLFYTMCFIMSSFIFIFSLSLLCCLSLPYSSTHSLSQKQRKKIVSRVSSQHDAFIMALYRNSNFHMIYNMIFLFLIFIYWWMSRILLLYEYEERQRSNFESGMLFFSYTMSELNIAPLHHKLRPTLQKERHTQDSTFQLVRIIFGSSVA